MADDSTVEVRITGSVDPSLSAATAQVKAVMEDTGNSVNVSANAMRDALKAAGGDIGKITPEMLGMASAASSSSTTMASAAENVGSSVASNMERASAATNKFSGMTVRARTEVIVLAHEMIQGRFARIPGSIMVFAEAMGGLSLATWGVIGGVAAVAGGLGYLAYEAYETDKQNRSLANSFQLIGNEALVSKDSVAAERDMLSSIPGVTDKAAEGFLKLAAAHADWDNGLRFSVEQLMPRFGSTAEEQDKAAGKLMEVLSDLTESGFKKLDRELLALQPVQAEHIQNLIKTGQTAEAVNEILQVLSSRTGTYMNTIGEQHYAARMRVEELKKAIEEEAKVGDPMAASAGVIAYTRELERAEEQLKQLEADAKTFGLQQQQNQSKGAIDVLDQANVSLNKSVQRQQELGKLAAAQNVLEKNLSDLQAQRNPRNAKDIAYLQEKIALGTQVIAQQKQAYAAEDAAAAKRASRTAATEENKQWQTYVASERAKVQATQEGSQERLAIERQWQAEAARIYGLNSKQYSEAKSAVSETERRAADLQLSIMKENASSEVSILRTQREQKKSELDAEVVDNEISKQTEISALSAYDNQIIDIEKATAQAEIESIRKVTEARLNQNLGRAPTQTETSSALSEIPAYIEANNRIKQLDADRAAEHAKAAADMAEADKHASEQSEKSWDKMVKSITQAESSMISSLMSGRKTFGQAALSLDVQMGTQELDVIASNLTKRLLLSDQEFAKEKEQGVLGAILHRIFETQKTASAVAGAAQRNGVKAGEKAVDTSLAASSTAVTVAAQTAQTRAVVAGESAKLSAKVTGTEAGQVVEKTAGSTTVIGDAYKAASGTYSSVAQIPYVGWILAPIAAAGAFAAVMAFDMFEKGTDYAPGGMALVGERGPEIVNIPRGAQVIPNHKIANAISSSSVNSSSSVSNSSVANLTYSPTINAPGQASLGDMLSSDSKTMLKWINARMRDGSLKAA